MARLKPLPRKERLLQVQPVQNRAVHVAAQKLGGKANIDRSLLFVPREHPNLNASLGQAGYSVGNTVLQLVLDRRRSDQL